MSKNDIIKAVNVNLESKQKTLWEKEVTSQNKLRFYRIFKSDLNVEQFVRINLPMSHRSLLSQLRYGILPLRIETGRFINLPVNERKCVFCSDDAVETEIHFLFECQLYTTLRIPFYLEMEALKNNFSILSNEDKLKTLFSGSKFIRKFCSFLDNCHRKLSSELYK